MTDWRDLVADGVLVCPADKGTLVVDGTQLRCEHCARKYHVENEIPVLLLSEAIAPEAGI